MSKPPSSPSLPKYLQEYEISQDLRDLVHSLPMEKGWVLPHFHQYQDFWYTTKCLKGALAFQNHFQSQDTDILLVSTPKSGTTWLKALTFALVNRARYPNLENHPLLTSNPHTLVPFMEIDIYQQLQDPDLLLLNSPILVSTHLPYVSLPQSVKCSASKLVYLCRNPKDTFVSLWHFANKLRPKNLGNLSLEEAFDKFCSGVSLFGPFWEHVLGYWKESLERPDKVFFIKYDEIKENPTFYVRRLAEFIGCPFSHEEEAKGEMEDILRLCSFEKLSNLEVNKNGKLLAGEENKAFFRKGEVGDWMNYLSIEMAERLDSITLQKLHGSGLKF